MHTVLPHLSKSTKQIFRQIPFQQTSQRRYFNTRSVETTKRTFISTPRFRQSNSIANPKNVRQIQAKHPGVTLQKRTAAFMSYFSCLNKDFTEMDRKIDKGEAKENIDYYKATVRSWYNLQYLILILAGITLYSLWDYYSEESKLDKAFLENLELKKGEKVNE